MKLSSLMLTLLLAALPAQAATGADPLGSATTVRVTRCTGGVCVPPPAYGSAVVIGTAQGEQTWVLLTCRHVIAGGTSMQVLIAGEWVPATVVRDGRGDPRDLALLGIRSPHRLHSTPITAQVDPQPGDPLRILANGPQRQTILTGTVRRIGTYSGRVKTIGISTDGAVLPGDSGAGVIDPQGNLVGILWGGSRQTAEFTPVSEMITWLQQHWGGLPQGPSTTIPIPRPVEPVSIPAASEPAVPDPPAVAGVPAAQTTQPPAAISVGTSPVPQVAEDPRPHSETDRRLDQLHGMVQTAISLATWLGIGGMTGGAGGLVLGGVALWRTISKRRRSRAARDPPVLEKPPVVTLDSPPPPQAIVRENQFVPYERDTYAEAFAWASAELARKYPGSVSTLETLRSLIDQYLSARGLSRET